MKLSEVNISHLDSKLIKNIFFSIKKESYNYADYLIIYGCHIKELLDERLDYALKILRNHSFGKIILTGGIGKYGDFNESEYMKHYLMQHSIEESKIIVENKSKTSEENNLNIMNMLQLNEVDCSTRIVLVTQEVHMIRLMLHWSKIVRNHNIHFYYDYVENSMLSYDNILDHSELIDVIKTQMEKIKWFIREGKYVDIKIEDISNNDKERSE